MEMKTEWTLTLRVRKKPLNYFAIPDGERGLREADAGKRSRGKYLVKGMTAGPVKDINGAKS